MAQILAQTSQIVTPLDAGWRVAVVPAGAWDRATTLAARDTDAFVPAPVPGTVAAALMAAGRYDPAQPTPLHDKDAWYVTTLDAGPCRLVFEGLATFAEVFLDGEMILTSTGMFEAHAIDVDPRAGAVLAIRFTSLDAALEPLKGPRAKWRPQMIANQKLRLVRTTLLGHMPGWCPEVHAVGPWRPILRIDHRPNTPVRIDHADLRATLDGATGTLSFDITGDWPEGATATLSCGGAFVTLSTEAGRVAGRLDIPDVAPWWPRTHGTPALHEVRLEIAGTIADLGRVGFRSITIDRGPDGRRFDLLVNGVRIFCRGAVWTDADLVRLPGDRASLEPEFDRLAAAHVNMVRVGGTMAYQGRAFHDLCDERGILVFQDLMFANFDYPAADPTFLAQCEREVRQFLDRLQTSPSLAILCGGSEVQQQAAMLGLPARAFASDLFDRLVPEIVAAIRPDVAYIPSSPYGGELPFVADCGVTHYYGVGAYERPLEDARRANVTFAAECLAFANVPDETTLARHLAVPAVHDPRWKARVPRDLGASWDFEDTRDHYLGRIFDLDPARLRREDPARYLDASRAVVAEVIERTFDEWRRPGSPTAGALVWNWKDFLPGAGWGVTDATGRPKSAWYAMRRAFAPLRIILMDEGVNGLHVHVVNDRPMPVAGRLSLACLKDGATVVVRGERDVEVPARGSITLRATELFGAFFDATYAYRFGPPGHDLTVARLTAPTEAGAAPETAPLLAEAVHVPRWPTERTAVGLAARVDRDAEGWFVAVSAARAALHVHVADDTRVPLDDGFAVVPGRETIVRFFEGADPDARPAGTIRALNGLAPARY
jgi:beta-mannosidase